MENFSIFNKTLEVLSYCVLPWFFPVLSSRINSRIKKFVKAHHRFSRLQDELKRQDSMSLIEHFFHISY